MSVDNLLQAAQANKRGSAPVHLWNPPFCGDIDMRIARDGTWYYLGTPIGRHAMVQLFSRIIRRDGEQYFLVTPVEKVGIRVDDAPFIAVDMQVEGTGNQQILRFITNVGDEVTADAEHPIRVVIDKKSGEPSPYILVRNNLEALIHRNLFYRLVELAEEQSTNGENWLAVYSSGQCFPIGSLQS